MPKKRKLTEKDDETLKKCLHVPGASERAVHEIWNLFHGKESSCSRRTFQNVLNESLQEFSSMAVLEDLLCKNGAKLTIPIMNVQAFIQFLCQKSTALADALQRSLSANMALTPVIYLDECTAGNVVGVEQDRKCTLMYLSWLELWHHLKNPNAWLPIAAVQANALKTVVSGSSALMVAALKHNLTRENAASFNVTLPSGKTFCMKQKQKAFFLGDNDAIRTVYNLKGSSGMRPCMFCSNVLMKESNVVDLDPIFVELSAAKGFQSVTDEEIWNAAEELVGIRSKAALDRKEKVCGLKLEEKGLLLDRNERWKLSPSQCLTDPMHTYFTNGCASWEVVMFCQSVFKDTPLTLSHLQHSAEMAQWKSTKSSGKNSGYVRRLFDQRLFGDSLYKGKAHQTAAIVPLLRFYAETVIAPFGVVQQAILDSFYALCDIVFELRTLQHAVVATRTCEVQRLNRLQEKHQDLFCKAYGHMACKPKHHHRFHLADSIKASKQLLGCDPLEGKHQIYKDMIGRNQHCTVSDYAKFSAAVLKRVCNISVARLVRGGLPFWQLLPPMELASLDDHLLLASQRVQKSKSALAPTKIGNILLAVCPLDFTFQVQYMFGLKMVFVQLRFFLSGCYLVATDWTVGDILLWPDHGGIAEYFLSCDGRLFVYCEKLDIAPLPKV